MNWSFQHPTRGTCEPGCPSWGRCHCSPDCPERPSVAHSTIGPRLVKRCHPYVFARGHNPRSRPGHPRTDLVPLERVKPLLRFLLSRYGQQKILAFAIGTTPQVLNRWVLGKVPAVDHRSAKRLVALVLSLQPADRLLGCEAGQAPKASRPGREFLVTSAPLRDLLTRRAAVHAPQRPSAGGGGTDLALLYAQRFGLSDREAYRHWRVVMTRDVVSGWLADQWATFVGVHPSELWGEDWEAAS